jgi:hypothetical protein
MRKRRGNWAKPPDCKQRRPHTASKPQGKNSCFRSTPAGRYRNKYVLIPTQTKKMICGLCDAIDLLLRSIDGLPRRFRYKLRMPFTRRQFVIGSMF